MMQDE
jgi:DNA replication licensing factor MCM6